MLREPSSRARDPGMESPFPQEVCDVSDPHDASSSLLLRLFAPVPSLERPPNTGLSCGRAPSLPPRGRQLQSLVSPRCAHARSLLALRGR
jgi:hypothetical protein